MLVLACSEQNKKVKTKRWDFSKSRPKNIASFECDSMLAHADVLVK